MGATTLTTRVPQVRVDLKVNVMKILHEAADAIRTDYQANAAVDTGAGRTSCYISAPDGSDYEERTGAASGLRPETDIADEIRPESDHEVVVAVAAGHMIYPEFGTVRQAAQPAFVPAVEAERGRFAGRFIGVVS